MWRLVGCCQHTNDNAGFKDGVECPVFISSATVGFSIRTLFHEVRKLIREFLAQANYWGHQIRIPPHFEDLGFEYWKSWKYLQKGAYFRTIWWKASAIKQTSQFSGLELTPVEKHFQTAAFSWSRFKNRSIFSVA
jgi:hypothetical protein